MISVAVVMPSLLLIAAFASVHVGRAGAAILAPVLFASMPVVWLTLGGAAPQVVLVPLMLAWLLACDRFYRTELYLWLAIAGAALGAMIYLHLAGLVMSPIYLAVGALALLPRRDRVTAIASLIAGFVVVVLPWVVLTARDGSAITTAINGYGLYDASRFNPLQGAREIGSWVGLTARSEVYWDCFNPALLFLGKGGLLAEVIGSQVFLLPLAIPLVRGLFAYLTDARSAMDWIVVSAFAVSPAAAALLARPPVASRLILLAPLAAIIATRGCYRGALKTSVAASPVTPVTGVASV